MYTEVSHNISVSVTPSYDREQSDPSHSFYFFIYNVTIQNDSSEPIQVLDRHWVITDGLGKTEEVTGDGVVGETPTIAPGQTYTYTSACPLQTKTGNMRGSYGILQRQNKVRIQIPLFFLRTPDSFH